MVKYRGGDEKNKKKGKNVLSAVTPPPGLVGPSWDQMNPAKSHPTWIRMIFGKVKEAHELNWKMYFSK